MCDKDNIQLNCIWLQVTDDKWTKQVNSFWKILAHLTGAQLELKNGVWVNQVSEQKQPLEFRASGELPLIKLTTRSSQHLRPQLPSHPGIM